MQDDSEDLYRKEMDEAQDILGDAAAETIGTTIAIVVTVDSIAVPLFANPNYSEASKLV